MIKTQTELLVLIFFLNPLQRCTEFFNGHYEDKSGHP